MSDIPFIRTEDIDGFLSWSEVAEALATGHTLPKATVRDALVTHAGNSNLTRVAWVPGLGIGLKSMTVFPANPRRAEPLPTIQGICILFDGDSGSVLALIDGAMVTRWKTAGDSVLGARLLARPDSTSLLIVGAGVVGHSLVEAYSSVIPSIRRIMIWNRTAPRAKELAREMAAKGYPTDVATDLAVAIREADIVSAATLSVEPVIAGGLIGPGTHVDLIGAYTPKMREADDELMRKARVFVDARETTVHEIGELISPISRGVIAESDVLGDLYDLCNHAPGRRSRDEITLFKNGGGAHLDLMTAELIYRKYTNRQ